MDTYNGWTNYQTWAVALWLDNEESTQKYWQEQANEARENNPDDDDGALSDLGQQLKDFVEENTPDLGASMYSDLLSASIEAVNFWEIAKNMLEED